MQESSCLGWASLTHAALAFPQVHLDTRGVLCDEEMGSALLLESYWPWASIDTMQVKVCFLFIQGSAGLPGEAGPSGSLGEKV